MFTEYMPAKARELVDTLGLLLAAVMMLLISCAGALQAAVTKEQMVTTMVLLIPLYPFYYILSLGYLAYAIVLIVDAIENFRLFLGAKPKETTGERDINLN